jgi:hypothetical protein
VLGKNASTFPTRRYIHKENRIMENLIATSILVFVFYALLFCPSKKAPTDTVKESTETVIETNNVPSIEPSLPVQVKEIDSKLSELTIRQLKQLASLAKIKGYGKMNKQTLIKNLGGLETATMAIA